MTITATRSWKSYNTLCSMLQKNDIPFERDDEDLRVCCCVSSGEKERLFVFETDPSKMLITLKCELPFSPDTDVLPDIAIGCAVINNELECGGFCLDIAERRIYYRMTASFYESSRSRGVFEYMLSSAADAADRFCPKLEKMILAGADMF